MHFCVMPDIGVQLANPLQHVQASVRLDLFALLDQYRLSLLLAVQLDLSILLLITVLLGLVLLKYVYTKS